MRLTHVQREITPHDNFHLALCEMEKNAQWTNEKSVQLPSNTNLADGYILINTVLCNGNIGHSKRGDENAALR